MNVGCSRLEKSKTATKPSSAYDASRESSSATNNLLPATEIQEADRSTPGSSTSLAVPMILLAFIVRVSTSQMLGPMIEAFAGVSDVGPNCMVPAIANRSSSQKALCINGA